jgi:hypothetical protein
MPDFRTIHGFNQQLLILFYQTYRHGLWGFHF